MTRPLLLACTTAALLLGCGDAKTDASSAAPSGSAKSTTTTKASSAAKDSAAPAATSAAPAAPAMVDHDLSTADAKWAGWTAKGPSDAKVMQDGVGGARIAGKGPSIMDRKPGGDEGFDIAFEWGKADLKAHAKAVKKGADDSKSKYTVIKEDAGRLEYTVEGENHKGYYFMLHMNVDKKDITCKNGNMMGAGNEAEHKALLEACATLAKKK